MPLPVIINYIWLYVARPCQVQIHPVTHLVWEIFIIGPSGVRARGPIQGMENPNQRQYSDPRIEKQNKSQIEGTDKHVLKSWKDLFIPYTLGDGSFFKALYCSVLVLIKNLSFYDCLEIENWRRKKFARHFFFKRKNLFI